MRTFNLPLEIAAYDPYEKQRDIYDAHGDVIGYLDNDDVPDDVDEMGSDLIARVNALAGVSDPAAFVASWHEMLEWLSAGNPSPGERDIIARARAAGPVSK